MAQMDHMFGKSCMAGESCMLKMMRRLEVLSYGYGFWDPECEKSDC